MNEFTHWLNLKFLEWQSETGQRQTLKAFAQCIGVKPTTLSSWLNADVLPTGDKVQLLADKLGYEVYGVLGIEAKEPVSLQKARVAYNELPPERQAEFSEQLEKVVDDWMKANGFRRVK